MRDPLTFFLLVIRVALPIAVGASIYIGWRSPDLQVFHWIENLGAASLIVRPTTPIASWMLYSLPDGLWCLAFTNWMLLIWNRAVPWVWTGVILGVTTELGQLLGIVPGTYELLDIGFYTGGFVFARTTHAQTR